MKGKQLSETQAEKVRKQQTYLLAVDETIDALQLFIKHYKPEPQDAGHVGESSGSEEETKAVPT